MPSLSLVFAPFLNHLLLLMILLFGAPSFDQYIGRCLILVDDRDFEDYIIHLDDISVVINTDLFGILLDLFVISDILLIKVFS
jgi:hypothetical protein